MKFSVAMTLAAFAVSALLTTPILAEDTPEQAPAPAVEATPAAPADAAAATGTPAFVGTWATDAAACTVSQDEQSAPMVLTEKGFDQHESHCTFSKVEAGEKSWTVSADCSVEGDTQSHEFVLSVDGDTLKMDEDVGAATMVRCKS
jgi:hypothetical protein